MRRYYAFDQIPFDEAPARNALCQLISDQVSGVIWLICDGTTLVGYIVLTFGYSLEYHGREVFIDEFFIQPSHRGMGGAEGPCGTWRMLPVSSASRRSIWRSPTPTRVHRSFTLRCLFISKLSHRAAGGPHRGWRWCNCQRGSTWRYETCLCVLRTIRSGTLKRPSAPRKGTGLDNLHTLPSSQAKRPALHSPTNAPFRRKTFASDRVNGRQSFNSALPTKPPRNNDDASIPSATSADLSRALAA